MEELKNNAQMYSLQKLASDLKADLKHLKRCGVDPRSFLAGRCHDYIAQIDHLAAIEKRKSLMH